MGVVTHNPTSLEATSRQAQQVQASLGHTHGAFQTNLDCRILRPCSKTEQKEG